MTTNSENVQKFLNVNAKIRTLSLSMFKKYCKKNAFEFWKVDAKLNKDFEFDEVEFAKFGSHWNRKIMEDCILLTYLLNERRALVHAF